MGGDTVRQSDRVVTGQDDDRDHLTNARRDHLTNARNEIHQEQAKGSSAPKTDNGNGNGQNAGETRVTGPAGSPLAGTVTLFSGGGSDAARNGTPFGRNGHDGLNGRNGNGDSLNGESSDLLMAYEKSPQLAALQAEGRQTELVAWQQPGRRGDGNQGRGIKRGDGLLQKEEAKKREAEAKVRPPLYLESSLEQAPGIYLGIYHGKKEWGETALYVMQEELLRDRRELKDEDDIDKEKKLPHNELSPRDIRILRQNIEALNKGDFETYIEPSLRAAAVMSHFLKKGGVSSFANQAVDRRIKDGGVERDDKYVEAFLAPEGSDEALRISYYENDPSHKTYLDAVTLAPNPKRMNTPGAAEAAAAFGLDQKVADEGFPISSKEADVNQRINSILTTLAGRDIDVVQLRAAANKPPETQPPAAAGTDSTARPIQPPAEPTQPPVARTDATNPTTPPRTAAQPSTVTAADRDTPASAGAVKPDAKTAAASNTTPNDITTTNNASAPRGDASSTPPVSPRSTPSTARSITPSETRPTDRPAASPPANVVEQRKIQTTPPLEVAKKAQPAVNGDATATPKVENPQLVVLQTPKPTNPSATDNTAQATKTDTKNTVSVAEAAKSEPTKDSTTISFDRIKLDKDYEHKQQQHRLNSLVSELSYSVTGEEKYNSSAFKSQLCNYVEHAPDVKTALEELNKQIKPGHEITTGDESKTEQELLIHDNAGTIIGVALMSKNALEKNATALAEAATSDSGTITLAARTNQNGTSVASASEKKPTSQEVAKPATTTVVASTDKPGKTSTTQESGQTKLQLFNAPAKPEATAAATGGAEHTTAEPADLNQVEEPPAPPAPPLKTEAASKPNAEASTPAQARQQTEAPKEDDAPPVSPTVTISSDTAAAARAIASTTRPVQAVTARDTNQPAIPSTVNRDAPQPKAITPANNDGRPTVVARNNADRPVVVARDNTGRLTDSATSRPKISVDELLKEDKKFQWNLSFGNHLRDPNRDDYDPYSPYNTYKKALTYLHTGNMEGMNEFSAKGPHPMSNPTAMALDKMFKANGLRPYMPDGKNSGITVMALDDGPISEGIRSSTRTDGSSKLEYVTLEHATGLLGKRGLGADIKRGLRGYDPVKPYNEKNEKIEDIERVGNIIQKRISGRTIIETLKQFGPPPPPTAVARRDTVQSRIPQPNNGATRSEFANVPISPETKTAKPASLNKVAETSTLPQPRQKMDATTEEEAPPPPPGAEVLGTKTNALGATVRTDADKNLIGLKRTNGAEINNVKYGEVNGHKALLSYDKIQNGQTISWSRDGKSQHFVGKDSAGKVVGGLDNIKLYANGNVTYSDRQKGDVIVRSDGHELLTGRGRPTYEFDDLGRFSKISGYKTRKYEYNGNTNELAKVTVHNPHFRPELTFTHQLDPNKKTWSCVDNSSKEGKAWDAPQGTHHLDQSTGAFTLETSLGQPNNPVKVFQTSQANGATEFRQLAFNKDGSTTVRQFDMHGQPRGEQNVGKDNKAVNDLTNSWKTAHAIKDAGTVQNKPDAASVRQQVKQEPPVPPASQRQQVKDEPPADEAPPADPYAPPAAQSKGTDAGAPTTGTTDQAKTNPPVEAAKPPAELPKGNVNPGANPVEPAQPPQPPQTSNAGVSLGPIDGSTATNPNTTQQPAGSRSRGINPGADKAVPAENTNVPAQPPTQKPKLQPKVPAGSSSTLERTTPVEQPVKQVEKPPEKTPAELVWDKLNPAERQLGLDIIAYRDKFFANWGANKPPQLILDVGLLKGWANANNNAMQARGASGHFVSGNPNHEISYHGPRSPQEALYGSMAVYGQNFAPGFLESPSHRHIIEDPTLTTFCPSQNGVNYTVDFNRQITQDGSNAYKTAEAQIASTRTVDTSSPTTAPRAEQTAALSPEAATPIAEQSRVAQNNSVEQPVRTKPKEIDHTAESAAHDWNDLVKMSPYADPGPEFRAKVIAELEKQNPKILQALKNRGVQEIELVSSYRDLARSNGSWSRLQNLDAFTANDDPHHPKIYLARDKYLENDFIQVPDARLPYAINHEFGHILANSPDEGTHHTPAEMYAAQVMGNSVLGWSAADLQRQDPSTYEQVRQVIKNICQDDLARNANGPYGGAESRIAQNNPVEQPIVAPQQQTNSNAQPTVASREQSRPGVSQEQTPGSPEASETAKLADNQQRDQYNIPDAAKPESLEGNSKLGKPKFVKTDDEGNRQYKYDNGTGVVTSADGTKGRIVDPVNLNTGYQRMEGFGPNEGDRYVLNYKAERDGSKEYQFPDHKVVIRPASELQASNQSATEQSHDHVHSPEVREGQENTTTVADHAERNYDTILDTTCESLGRLRASQGLPPLTEAEKANLIASPEFVDKVKQGLNEKLSERALEIIKAAGVKVVLAKDLSGVNPAMIKTPVGVRGGTYAHIDGYYDSITRELVLTENTANAKGHYEPSKATLGTLMHELGHVIEANNPGGRLRNSPEFIKAYNEDIQEIARTVPLKGYKYGHLDSRIHTYIDPNTRMRISNGEAEAWAELHAAYTGHATNIGPPDKVIKLFHRSYDVVKSQIESGGYSRNLASNSNGRPQSYRLAQADATVRPSPQSQQQVRPRDSRPGAPSRGFATIPVTQTERAGVNTPDSHRNLNESTETSFHLTSYFLPTPDQKTTGSCLYNSATTIAEFLTAKADGNPNPQLGGENDFSERWTMELYKRMQFHGQSPLQNEYTDAVDFLDRGGTVQNNELPYRAYPDTRWEREALLATDGLHVSHNLPKYEKDVLVNAGGEGHQKSIGVMTVEDLNKIKTFLREHESPVLFVYGGDVFHANVITGFDDERQVFKMRDSYFGKPVDSPWGAQTHREECEMSYKQALELGNHATGYRLASRYNVASNSP